MQISGLLEKKKHCAGLVPEKEIAAGALGYSDLWLDHLVPICGVIWLNL